MPTRAVQNGTSATPFLLPLAVVAAGVFVWLRYPAAVPLILLVSLAAMLYQAPVPASAKEVPDLRSQRRARTYRELRWRLIFPNEYWLPNLASELGRKVENAPTSTAQFLAFALWLVPTRFVTIAAVALALGATTLPIDGALPWGGYLPAWWVWLNALYAYVAVAAVDTAVRQFAAPYDPSPGVGVHAVVASLADEESRDGAIRGLVGMTLLGVGAGVGTSLLIDYLGAGWLFVPLPLLCAAVGVVVAAAGLHAVFRARGLEEWRELVRSREEWDGVWDGLKHPDVHLLTHAHVGDAVVDTFRAPPGLGAVGAIQLYGKILPYRGTGVQVAMLTVPNTDSQGQPVPGSAHPSEFRVVTWPSDASVNLADLATPQDVVELRSETMAFLSSTEARMPVPVLLSSTAQHTPDSPSAMWQLEWTTEMPNLGGFLGLLDEPGFALGTSVFVGDIDSATLSDPSLRDAYDEYVATERWAQRWRDVLKMNAIAPRLEYRHAQQARLADGTTIHYQPFIFPQGLSLSDYFEPYISQKLSSTLKAAPFVTVIGVTGAMVQGGAPGERHKQAFAVVWSERAVPTSPANVQASPRGRGGGQLAQKWVFGGMVNAGFDAAKLPRPEVVNAKCLTSAKSVGSIWRLDLRLFGGVTTAMLKMKLEVLRSAMGNPPWLRVTEWDHGATMYVGVLPGGDEVQFAEPTGRAECDNVDWEAAFLSVGLTATDGSAPKLLSVAPLETNPKITRREFTLPSPLSHGRVREATSKLMPATGNAYVEVRHGDSADRMVILACETNPMPFPAFLDWESMLDVDGAGATRVPFAAAVDGSTVVFDWTVDTHLNVLGASNSGKSFLMIVLLAGFIARGCEVIALDPVKGGADFAFAAPWTRATAEQGDFIGAGEIMQAVYTEVTRRKELRMKYKVGTYRELPDDVRPPHMVVVVDEFQSLIKSKAGQAKAPASDDPEVVAIYERQRLTNLGVDKLTDGVGRLAREARSDGVTVILAGQAMRASDLEKVGLGGLKNNFSRIAVGKMGPGELSSAFKDTSSLPPLGPVIPKGRGLFESTSEAARVVQTFFEPGGTDEYIRRLREVAAVIPDDEKWDVHAMTSKVLEVLPRRFGEEIASSDDEVVDIDLGEDFELGLDFTNFASEDEAAPVDDDVTPVHVEELQEPPTPREGELGEVVLVTDELVERYAVDGAPLTAWGPGDAMVAFVDAHPGVRTLVWGDPELDSDDEVLAIPHRAIVTPLFEERGVTIVDPDEPHVSEPEEEEPFELIEPPYGDSNPVLEDDEDDMFAAPVLNVPKQISF